MSRFLAVRCLALACPAIGCLMLIVIGCGYEQRPAFPGKPEALQLGPQNQVAADAGGQRDPAGAPSPKPVQRRIVYHTMLDLVVEDFAQVPRRVLELRDRFGAYIADSNVTGQSGTPRMGYWKVRVPIEKLDDFLAAARGLGELRSERQQAEDVTDKYYDLDARLRNKKKQETRLLELLADRTAKLEDVVKVEGEVSRVREEIERLEGQLRLVDNLSAMATVTLQIYEIKNFLPDDSADLATRISRTWAASLENLRMTGECIAILAAALGPWLIVLAVLVGLLSLIVRRWRRTHRASAYGG